MDLTGLLIWQKFNCYNFVESSHQYYYYDTPVKTSVTTWIGKFFPTFDSDTISSKYAKKHNLTQEQVLADWKRKSDISATSGTIIHSWLENAKRGKTFDIDYSIADKLNILDEVKERVNILLPKAKEFHKDTLGKLYPIQLEYTVGIKDYIAGNIDMLCWNDYAKEFQIWDYKNTKEISTNNPWGNKCLKPFQYYADCSLVHYSIQLNTYKYILKRQLGINIGSMYLVHFNYTKKDDTFKVFQCQDMQNLIGNEIESLVANKL